MNDAAIAAKERTSFITPGYLFATILIVGLFFMWGVANSLNDVLIPQFRKAFQLDDFASSLVQSAFYFGYFCFAIPASLFMRRFGYRAAVLMGLGLYGAGALLFPPTALTSGSTLRRRSIPSAPCRARTSAACSSSPMCTTPPNSCRR